MFRRNAQIIITAALSIALLTACGDTIVAPADTSTTAATSVAASSAPSNTAASVLAENTAPSATAVSVEADTDTVQISLDGATITAGGAGVSVDGGTATITAAGSYQLSGSLSDGQIVVDSDDSEPVQLILSGADISSSTSAPIYVRQADSVVIVLADGTQNKLADATSYVYASADEDEPNAALFSDDELTIAGNGSLTITASYNDGIASKDGLTIAGGTITISAVDDGVRGKDYLIVQGGDLTVTAGGDGLNSDADITINGGDFQIAAGDDAVHADAGLAINGGTMTVSRSYEGLEGADITISAGTIAVVASDDGVNGAGDSATATTTDAGAPPQGGQPPQGGGRPPMGGPMGGGNFSLTISGGSLTVDAGGDGIDVNGSITMSGGTVILNGPTEQMNGALDYDRGFSMSGGTLVAAGSAGMAMTPDQTSTQNALLIYFDQAQAAGTPLSITSSAGQELLSFTPAKAYQSLAFSSAELASGETYTVALGGAEYTSFTVSGTVTQVGSGGRFR